MVLGVKTMAGVVRGIAAKLGPKPEPVVLPPPEPEISVMNPTNVLLMCFASLCAMLFLIAVRFYQKDAKSKSKAATYKQSAAHRLAVPETPVTVMETQVPAEPVTVEPAVEAVAEPEVAVKDEGGAPAVATSQSSSPSDEDMAHAVVSAAVQDALAAVMAEVPMEQKSAEVVAEEAVAEAVEAAIAAVKDAPAEEVAEKPKETVDAATEDTSGKADEVVEKAEEAAAEVAAAAPAVPATAEVVDTGDAVAEENSQTPSQSGKPRRMSRLPSLPKGKLSFSKAGAAGKNLLKRGPSFSKTRQ